MSTAPTVSVRTLRRTLAANAAFSALCAVAFLSATRTIAELVGAPPAEILSTGASLALFVAMLVVAITWLPTLSRWVLGLAVLIAALDVLWVLGTPLNIGSYTTAGKWIFIDIAVMVAILGTLQIRALIGIFRNLRTPA